MHEQKCERGPYYVFLYFFTKVYQKSALWVKVTILVETKNIFFLTDESQLDQKDSKDTVDWIDVHHPRHLIGIF